jgi:predicted Rossmann fold nucleotide-binding protein DprA/Smf involved in DNA uptake
MVSKKRSFQGMSYREVQRTNTQNRIKLDNETQNWLKINKYKNVGWQNVINLYQKIEELLDKSQFKDMSLEELFLEADRIGDKYQTPEEKAEFNQKLAKEVAEIGELIDKQFPDTETEVIDYSKNLIQKATKKQNQKTYRTTEI